MIMPHVIKLADGKLLTPFSIKDILEEIESYMGGEIRQYIEEWKAEIEEAGEADRGDRAEAEEELERINDHLHSILCDLKEEADALEELLQAERLNRQKLLKSVRLIQKMLYQEL